MNLLGLIDKVNQQPLTHEVIAKLQLRRVANAALGKLPLVRTLPSGVVYRCRYLDTLVLANDIFRRRVYAGAVDSDVTTICDLGCNVGHFVAFVADFTGRRNLKGLAVDASRDMIEETAWVVTQNGLDGIHPVLGLVGAGEAGTPGDFFIHPVSLLSSRYAIDHPGEPKKGDWEKSSVSYIDLESLWLGTVGDVACDLLKVDIEGSESELLVESNPFIKRTKKMVVECHKWVQPFDELEVRLKKMGFVRRNILDEHEAWVIAVYERSA